MYIDIERQKMNIEIPLEGVHHLYNICVSIIRYSYDIFG